MNGTPLPLNLARLESLGCVPVGEDAARFGIAHPWQWTVDALAEVRTLMTETTSLRGQLRQIRSALGCEPDADVVKVARLTREFMEKYQQMLQDDIRERVRELRGWHDEKREVTP